jgi:hypothetical protein
VTRQSAAEKPAGTKSSGTGSGFGDVVAQADKTVQTAAGRNRFMVSPFVWVRDVGRTVPHTPGRWNTTAAKNKRLPDASDSYLA